MTAKPIKAISAFLEEQKQQQKSHFIHNHLRISKNESNARRIGELFYKLTNFLFHFKLTVTL